MAVAQALDAAGLMPNKSGNVSARTPVGLVITPAGTPYAELTPGEPSRARTRRRGHS